MAMLVHARRDAVTDRLAAEDGLRVEFNGWLERAARRDGTPAGRSLACEQARSAVSCDARVVVRRGTVGPACVAGACGEGVTPFIARGCERLAP